MYKTPAKEEVEEVKKMERKVSLYDAEGVSFNLLY